MGYVTSKSGRSIRNNIDFIFLFHKPDFITFLIEEMTPLCFASVKSPFGGLLLLTTY